MVDSRWCFFKKETPAKQHYPSTFFNFGSYNFITGYLLTKTI